MDRLALKMGRRLSGSLVVRGLHFDADIGVLRVFLKPSVADIEFAMIGASGCTQDKRNEAELALSVWRGRRRRLRSASCGPYAIGFRDDTRYGFGGRVLGIEVFGSCGALGLVLRVRLRV